MARVFKDMRGQYCPAAIPRLPLDLDHLCSADPRLFRDPIGRDYNFSLSPNGGEGWGEGELWSVFAKIPQIDSRTPSVSCMT